MNSDPKHWVPYRQTALLPYRTDNLPCGAAVTACGIVLYQQNAETYRHLAVANLKVALKNYYMLLDTGLSFSFSILAAFTLFKDTLPPPPPYPVP
jgi:hypothetical protein